MDELIEFFMCESEDCDDKIGKVAHDIQSRKNSILDLVEKLGPHLTNKETATRIKACSLIGNVLLKLKDDFLSNKELECLVGFFCARLQDHYTLQPSVLVALNKISASLHLTEKDAKNLVMSITKEVHVQSCLQSERFQVYQIFRNVLDIHQQLIISMGKDFLCSFIQAIDGEQDPRNLLIVFQLSADLVHNGIDISGQEEELFEVTSCYFPIDFNPASAGKKTSITNQDLVFGLRRAISSTNKFAQYCIPLMLEKMESDVESAKIDAILTLKECLPKYTKSNLESFLTSLWRQLKQEIVNAASQEVEKNALELLTQLVNNLSQWPVDMADGKVTDLHSFLKEVLDDCLPRLKEPIQDKLTWMSGLMLLACAKGSSAAYREIAVATVPLFLEQACQAKLALTTETNPATPLKTTSFLSIIESLVKIVSTCSMFSFQEHPLSSFQTNILHLFKEVLMQDFSTQAKCASIAGLASLLSLNILNNDELQEIANCLLFLLINISDKQLRHETLSAAGYFSSKHSHITKAVMLPTLYAMIPIENFADIQIETVKTTLTSLSALSTHFEILKEVVSFLINLLEKCKIDEIHSSFLQELLICLQTVTKNCSSSQEHVKFLASNIFLPIMKMCIETFLDLSTPEQCCTSCSNVEGFSLDCISLPIMKSVAVVMRNICQKQSPGQTADFIIQLVTNLYLHGNMELFGIKNNKTNFTPFNPQFSLLQSRSVCFLTSTICTFDKAVTVPNVNEFLDKLMNLCLQTSDQPTFVAAAKAFSGLINKYHKVNEEMILKVRERCKGTIQEAQEGSKKKLSALTLLIWTTKALVLCNHKQTSEIVGDILSLLCDPDVGEIAAAGLDIILRESEEVLCSASHAVIRIMYHQRFFLLVLPKLVSGFHAASQSHEEKMDVANDGSSKSEMRDKERANYLTALSHLLLHLPKQVLLQEFSNLMPLLVQSMRSDDPCLLHSVLSALYCLLQDSSSLMENYIDSLLDDFLRLARFKSDLTVRLKAVQCIGASTLLPTHILLPLQSKVVRQLAAALDDHKRDVRNEAAKARSEWFLVGA